LLREVDVDRRFPRNQSRTRIPHTEAFLLASGGGRAALLCS
jgi:hypothetical protein